MAWVKPSTGFLKLNVKGVFDKEKRKGAVGCILRDATGSWTKGCAGMIGLAPPDAAELWALFYGLKMAWERDGDKKLIVESDCDEVMQAVVYPDPGYPYLELVMLINNLLSEKWVQLELLLVDKSANEAAKALADLSVDGDGGVDDLAEAPAAIRPIIRNEA